METYYILRSDIGTDVSFLDGDAINRTVWGTLCDLVNGMNEGPSTAG